MTKRTPTVGARRLRDALEPRVMSRVDLATELGVSRQAVSDWLSGDSLPKPTLMARIEEILGIPMRAWTEPTDEEPATGTHS